VRLESLAHAEIVNDCEVSRAVEDTEALPVLPFTLSALPRRA